MPSIDLYIHIISIHIFILSSQCIHRPVLSFHLDDIIKMKKL